MDIKNNSCIFVSLLVLISGFNFMCLTPTFFVGVFYLPIFVKAASNNRATPERFYVWGFSFIFV